MPQLFSLTRLRNDARKHIDWSKHNITQQHCGFNGNKKKNRWEFSTPELMAGRPLRSRGALVLCAVALGLAPSFVAQGLSRRHVGFLASGLILGTSQDAKAAVEVTQADKERLTRGYKELVYMMKNFNTVTRKCEKNQENIQRALQSGQASPDGCIANPLVVRKYLGQTSIKADLFNTKDLLVNMELAGMVPSKSEDEYGDLVEDFEAFKRQADEWAYSSSWAEANPGGGRDRTEDYLLRSKSLADKATKTLGRIVEILGLSENLYAWSVPAVPWKKTETNFPQTAPVSTERVCPDFGVGKGHPHDVRFIHCTVLLYLFFRPCTFSRAT